MHCVCHGLRYKLLPPSLVDHTKTFFLCSCAEFFLCLKIISNLIIDEGIQTTCVSCKNVGKFVFRVPFCCKLDFSPKRHSKRETRGLEERIFNLNTGREKALKWKKSRTEILLMKWLKDVIECKWCVKQKQKVTRNSLKCKTVLEFILHTKTEN